MQLPKGLEISDKLITALFEAEERRLAKRVEDIDQMNRETKGTKTYGFWHKGEFYAPSNSPYRSSQRGKEALAFALHRQGDAMIKDAQTVTNDKKMIEQIIYLLIRTCSTIQDIRDALPESLVMLSDELSKLPRLNQEGYTLIGDERAMGQFEKIRDKIDFYTATRLIY